MDDAGGVQVLHGLHNLREEAAGLPLEYGPWRSIGPRRSPPLTSSITRYAAAGVDTTSYSETTGWSVSRRAPPPRRAAP